MLRENYGTVIIKKDTILYHTSDELLKYSKKKPMLFCTFHPSDYAGDNEFINFIKIKKDIILLFMIDHIAKIKIYSSLEDFIEHPNKNLAKKHDFILKEMSKKLKKENLDGWFSSIENKSNVEVALINDKNIYEIYDSKEFKKNWNNGYYSGDNNEIIVQKRWGKYKISIIENPVILNINKKYKNMIEKYKQHEINSKFHSEYTFQIILDHAFINYI